MFCVLVNFNVYFVYDFILNKNKNIRLPAQLYFVQINRKRNSLQWSCCSLQPCSVY